MYYTIRESNRKKGTNEMSYKELEERYINESVMIGGKLQIGKDFYAVKDVIIASGLKDEKGNIQKENFIDVVKVSKDYEAPVDQKYRRDRYRHQIVKTKEGGEKTIDENGRTVREWDKTGTIIKGSPYPGLNRAGDGI